MAVPGGRLIRLCHLLLLIFHLAAPARADDLDKYDGQFRLAKELELKVLRLRYLMRYFRLSQDSVSYLSDLILDDYLDEPTNLEAVRRRAPAVYALLVEGVEADLHTKSIDVDTRPVKIEMPTSATLLGPDGNPFGDFSVITGPVTPKAATSPSEANRANVILSPQGAPMKSSAREVAWAKVRERWRGLTAPFKRGAVDADHLDPVTKAAVGSSFSDFLIPGREMAQLNFGPTQGGLELRDSNDVRYHQPRVFLEHLHDLGVKAGVTNYLEDPLGHHDGEASYHIHISTVDASRDLRPVVAAMNQLYLLRFLDAGEKESMFSRDGFGYRNDLKQRGLVRMYEPNHFEIRTHLTSPKKELAEVLGWLAAPEAETLTKIQAEIDRRLSVENLQELVKHPEGLLMLGGLASSGREPVAQRIQEPLKASARDIAGTLRQKASATELVKLFKVLRGTGFWSEVQSHLVSGNVLDMVARWGRLARGRSVVFELGDSGILDDTSPGSLQARLSRPAPLTLLRLALESDMALHSSSSTLLSELVQRAHPEGGWSSGARHFAAELFRASAARAEFDFDVGREVSKLLDLTVAAQRIGVAELNRHFARPSLQRELILKISTEEGRQWLLHSLPWVRQIPEARKFAEAVTQELAQRLMQRHVTALSSHPERETAVRKEFWQVLRAARPDLAWDIPTCDIFRYVD